MANKTRTTRIKGNTEYAKVADRLNEFRKANPRSKISVKHYHDEEGNLTSRAYIWKDKVDFYELLKSGVSSKEALESADSEGTSFMKASQLAKEKGFEKNETIAVGRALALLGYAASGEIASSEEMEEFERYQADKAEEARSSAIDSINQAQTMTDLQQVWMAFAKEQRLDKAIQQAKDKRKEELSDESSKAAAE